MKEQTRLLLEKARHTIHAAQILIRDGEPDSAASRAYYAMFYVASALLEERALRATKHSGVHALFGEHFAKSGQLDPKFHRFLLDSFDRRIHADYGFEAVITEQELLLTIDQACEFLSVAEKLLE